MSSFSSDEQMLHVPARTAHKLLEPAIVLVEANSCVILECKVPLTRPHMYGVKQSSTRAAQAGGSLLVHWDYAQESSQKSCMLSVN